MKKTTLFAVAAMAATTLSAQTVESFYAVDINTTDEGTTTTLIDCFANAVIETTSSEVLFGTDNLSGVALGGTTPKDVNETEAGVFPGWSAWNDVKWEAKQQNLDDNKTVYFGYVAGTGNPYTAIEGEAVQSNGVPTGAWRPKYTYYAPDGSNGLPVSGLYYKLTPAQDGELCVAVWVNKGNRNTYVVDAANALPVAYSAQGYINGQNEQLEDGSNAKRFLTAADIAELHAGKINADGVDTAPYVIGAGNQPFWGYLTFAVEAGHSYLVFNDSSQIGFAGYEYTFEGGVGIASVQTSAPAVIFNIRGERVEEMKAGQTYIVNGKKVIR